MSKRVQSALSTYERGEPARRALIIAAAVARLNPLLVRPLPLHCACPIRLTIYPIPT